MRKTILIALGATLVLGTVASAGAASAGALRPPIDPGSSSTPSRGPELSSRPRTCRQSATA
jgi:hypothetical protein